MKQLIQVEPSAVYLSCWHTPVLIRRDPSVAERVTNRPFVCVSEVINRYLLQEGESIYHMYLENTLGKDLSMLLVTPSQFMPLEHIRLEEPLHTTLLSLSKYYTKHNTHKTVLTDRLEKDYQQPILIKCHRECHVLQTRGVPLCTDFSSSLLTMSSEMPP